MVVALAGCGSSDGDKVAAAIKQLDSAVQRGDGEQLCSEVLHPNTVRAFERLGEAEAPPGTRPSCARTFRGGSGRPEDLDREEPTADNVSIKGDVAYAEDQGRRVPIARRVGGEWKIDLTAVPTFAWRLHASYACVRWQDSLQALPLPSASRSGIIANLTGQAAAWTTFREELDAAAAPDAAWPAAADLEAALERVDAKLEEVTRALDRGRSLNDTIEKAAGDIRDGSVATIRAAGAAGLRCGRIPASAPDGAQFRRQATEICAPAGKKLSSIATRGRSFVAIGRSLRRASATMRRVRRDLARLEPPADLGGIYRDTLSALAALSAGIRTESDALVRRDFAAAGRALARVGPIDFRKGAGFARLGLPTCAVI